MTAENSLAGRRILLCVTASISAYKSVYLVRELTRRGAFVSVAITPAATRFVGTATFSALASEPAFDDLWDARGSIAHTTLGRNADCVVVAPATANTIAKMANGIADDIVTASLLCVDEETPLIIAPAMHEEMIDHPATQTNLNTLISRGALIVGPSTGELAGGDSGRGRLVEIDEIVEAVVKCLSGKPATSSSSVAVSLSASMQNHSEPKVSSLAANATSNDNAADFTRKTIVVTAGGTREPIDPVRVITNRSSGKMGHAIANAASAMGYHVILITTSDIASGADVQRIDVDTASEMHLSVMEHLGNADVVVMAAAVADVTPVNPSLVKLKREEGIETIELVPTADILKEVVAHKNSDTFVVGFAAETNDVLDNAHKKLASKGVDMLIANDVSDADVGFSSVNNHIWVLTPSSDAIEYGPAPKEALAYEILERISLG